MTVAPPGLHSRGLTWSVLAPHRVALRSWAGFIVLFGAGLLGTWLFGEHVQAAAAMCGIEDACADEVTRRESVYGHLVETASKGLLYVPAVIAAFAGAALIGREMESGTATLAWTQSVSPARWFAAKLAGSGLAVVGGMLLLTLLFRWVWESGVPGTNRPWSWPNTFAATGPVGTAYVLFALAAGAVAGLLVRRQLPALGLGVAVTMLVQALGRAHRAELWPTEKATGARVSDLSDAMILDAGALTPSGEEFSFARCSGVEPSLGLQACVERYDVERYVVFHPSSHYWPLQLVETGILVGLTAILTFVAVQFLRRWTA